ncbi:HEAT repeat domain-containing protein [Rheinheimera marina]|uniref:HEAT repeat domain-containing protein n=1 Tax=Rheinheimera marina TaxID=1774958 RepID=A0ABV9JJB3_9GAMM
MSATVSDPLLQLVWYSTAALLVLTLLLLVLALVMHKERDKRNLHRKEATEQWTPLLFSWIYDTEQTAEPLPSLDAAGFGVVVQLWLQLEQTVRGSASERLADLAQRLGFVPVMHQWLDSFDNEKKLTAIMTLGLVQDKKAFAKLMPYVIDSRTLFSLVAARSLLSIDPWLGLPVVLSQLHRDDWSVSRLAGLLVRLPSELVVRALTESAERATVKELGRLIKLMSLLSPLDCQPLVLLALEKYPDQMELMTTACSSTISPDLLPALRLLHNSPHWQVRVQLAKALGRLGSKDDVPLLLILLQDKSWWVRYRAAQSLLQLPDVSVEEQQHWLQLDDPFARDILHQVLDETERMKRTAWTG